MIDEGLLLEPQGMLFIEDSTGFEPDLKPKELEI